MSWDDLGKQKHHPGHYPATGLGWDQGIGVTTQGLQWRIAVGQPHGGPQCRPRSKESGHVGTPVFLLTYQTWAFLRVGMSSQSGSLNQVQNQAICITQLQMRCGVQNGTLWAPTSFHWKWTRRLAPGQNLSYCPVIQHGKKSSVNMDVYSWENHLQVVDFHLLSS